MVFPILTQNSAALNLEGSSAFIAPVVCGEWQPHRNSWQFSEAGSAKTKDMVNVSLF